MRIKRSHHGVFAVLGAALALSACTSLDLDSSAGWFSKPVDFFGRSGGFSYSELQQSAQDRPITPTDLVDGNGVCAADSPNAAQMASNGANPPPMPANPDALRGAAIGMGMSECDVVRRAGQPNSVQVGRSPNGDRNVTMTITSGPRPGLYRFVRGRLVDMTQVDQPLRQKL